MLLLVEKNQIQDTKRKRDGSLRLLKNHPVALHLLRHQHLKKTNKFQSSN
jgi:hypothetical protein